MANKARPKKNLRKTLALLACTIAVSAPHLIMERPGEMHAYPTLWMTALSLSVLLNDAGWRRWEKGTVALFLALSMCVFAHKGWYIYRNGQRGHSRVATAVKRSRFIPRPIAVVDLDKTREVYSVFSTTPQLSWANATGTRIYFDFSNPKTIDYRCASPKQKRSVVNKILAKKGGVECIWIVRNDTVTVYDVRASRPQSATHKRQSLDSSAPSRRC